VAYSSFFCAPYSSTYLVGKVCDLTVVFYCTMKYGPQTGAKLISSIKLQK